MYITLLAGWGESYISNDGSRIYVNELAYDMGFRNGDHIISFDDYEPENFFMLQADLARRTARKATVQRQNDTIDIYIDHSRLGEVLKSPGMFDLARPFTVNSVMAGSANEDAGLAAGDRIIKVADTPICFVQDAWPVLAELAGREISAAVVRGADTLSMPLQVDTVGRLGVYLEAPEVKTHKYTLAAAIPAGVKKTFSSIGGYLKDMKLVFTPSTEAYKSVGSFIAIGQVFPSAWDWYSFLSIIAMLSIMLAVMNLLPIPALDGGHIVFTLYEMVTGRKPSDNFLYVTQIIGMIIIFGLMFLAFGNDISRLIR
jgi:regulator of sigma E protease